MYHAMQHSGNILQVYPDAQSMSPPRRGPVCVLGRLTPKTYSFLHTNRTHPRHHRIPCSLLHLYGHLAGTSRPAEHLGTGVGRDGASQLVAVGGSKKTSLERTAWVKRGSNVMKGTSIVCVVALREDHAEDCWPSCTRWRLPNSVRQCWVRAKNLGCHLPFCRRCLSHHPTG